MGTNFYWIDVDKVEVPKDLSGDRTHLGKRSAAGYFCYSCNVPLVIGGDTDLVHTTHEVHLEYCPVCKEKKPEFHFFKSSVSIELGLKESEKGKPIKGIRHCCSFSYAQPKTLIQALCEKWKDEVVIEDEYGQQMTGQEFMQMLFANCPIEFEHSIGDFFC